jgi:ring-1,2-phenylacetyl-CoA epoxidase subunit PaaE
MEKEKLTERLVIERIDQETFDAYSLVFKIPDHLKQKFRYEAGQFVTLFLDIDGEDIRRSYSLSSSPHRDKDFRISIKRVAGGKVSNHLADHAQVGTELHVTPPAGRFVLPKNPDHQSLVFFAGGSGVTPILSMIKSALHAGPNNRVYLLYANRDENSIMFHRELLALNSEFVGRFSYDYVLSQPRKPWDGFKGRVHSSTVTDFVKKWSVPIRSEAYLCGPTGFMATVEATLEMLGYPKERIHQESFAAATTAATATTGAEGATTDLLDNIGPDAVLIGDKNLAGEPVEIEAILNGQRLKVTAKPHQSILETLLEAGHNPPYSCMDGACMACIGKVKEGLVYQNDFGILTEDNTEAGECLTCQARPASKKVVVNYDL